MARPGEGELEIDQRSPIGQFGAHECNEPDPERLHPWSPVEDKCSRAKRLLAREMRDDTFGAIIGWPRGPQPTAEEPALRHRIVAVKVNMPLKPVAVILRRRECPIGRE